MFNVYIQTYPRSLESECWAECVIYNSAGSVFLVAFSTPEQRGGNWYAHLVPQSRARTIARCPAKSQVVSFLERAGFDVVALQKCVTYNYYGLRS